MQVRFVVSVVSAHIVMCALGGCSEPAAPDAAPSSVGPSAPVQTPSSVAPEPTVDSIPAPTEPAVEEAADGSRTDDERAAVQAYRGFYELMPKVYASPGQAKTILASVAADPLLAKTQSAAWRNASRGWRVQGVPSLTPFIAKRKPGTIVIHDCQDHDAVRTVAADSGKLVYAGKPATPVQAEVRRVDGQWRVVSLDEAPLSANVCP